MTLDDLLVSGEELDKDLLRTALFPFIRIDKETLQLRPQAPFRDLTAKAKVVVLLLGRKGLRALGLISEEKCSPADIIREVGLPSGSVYPALKALYESRPQMVERDKDSNYWIPNWAVQDAVGLLNLGGQG